MRGLSILALLAVGALVLSGCSSKGGSSSSTSISLTLSTGKNSTKTLTNSSSIPNLPPIVKLTVTNTTGVATNVTTLKGSLVFSAVGSHDADTDGLSAVAITATDSNRTYPPGVLFAGGKFSSVTYTFDHAGAVNVTVSGIDVRGDLTTIHAQIFVNEVVKVDSKTSQVPYGSAYDVTKCGGPSGETVVDNGIYELKPFNVAKGAKWASVHLVSGTGNFVVCSPPPENKAISGKGTEKVDAVTTTPSLPMPAKSTDSYNVGMLTTTANAAFSVIVTVHYEPKPAA